MKKIGILLTLITALFFSSLVHAEDARPGLLAIGVHGIGTEWNFGRPMLRWRPSDSWAFDFTPVIGVADAGGTSDSKNYSYGLNVGIVKQFRSVGGVSVGWRMEIGYDYATSNDTAGTMTSNDRRQLFDLGFGPDLEYFVPVVPGLSIGASAQIHYRYASDKSTFTDSTTLLSSNSYLHESRLNLLGELLTIRYYF